MRGEERVEIVERVAPKPRIVVWISAGSRPTSSTMAVEDLQLVRDVGRPGGEQVARVGVLGDQPQRLALTAPADQDRWPRRAHGRGEQIVSARW